tara:strand:+ start:3802 stop:4071 length:270 start_codon:yes stop_codon:yes gene_type:complete
MIELTDEQAEQVFGAETHTHNFAAEGVASFKATGNNLIEELQARFATMFVWTEEEDLGGITAYANNGELVAFYDYENYKGTVVYAGLDS